jgi:hypothetical protein
MFYKWINGIDSNAAGFDSQNQNSKKDTAPEV